MNDINKERLLYVALDSNDEVRNLTLATNLSRETGSPCGFKINLDHFSLWGLPYLDEIQNLGSQVFVDLKMNNGPRTMTHIAETLVRKSVQHINVWALAEKEIRPVAEIVKGSRTKLLAVTVTTHFDEEYCQRHFRRSLGETVSHLSEVGLENGCDGIIVPGTVLDAVSNLNCLKLVSAIRPAWFIDKKANDQEQTVTPTQAIRGGADILVCGSPVHKSSNPREALTKVYQEMIKA